jgi:myo-inositol catabolism protein IolC
VIAESGWCAVRPSGTEDVYKLYAESFRDRAHLERIQAEAQALVTRILAKAPLSRGHPMMALGYNRPLYLVPFDHRQSYITGMFHFTPPLTADQHDIVADSKQIIYEGFRQALGHGVPTPRAGILVDEEFGAEILRDANAHGYVTALSTEKSGSDEFEFGTAFAEHIEAFRPTFAKVLVRYNPEGEAALNQRQTARLKQLSNYCRVADQRFMFELLVPATKAQMEHVRGDKQTYDPRIRPELMLQTIRMLQDTGVEPDIWKIEGLDRREDCERIVEMARRDGRANVGCIVLGRGADEKKVVTWLETAASVPGFIGFAVGRTTFWDAVAAYQAHTVTRQEASARIAQRFREWATIFERRYPSGT